MELNPASDTWVDTVRIEPKVIDVEGDYAAQVALLQQTENLDPQTGFAPIVWNAWETNWTGFEFNDTTTTRTTSQTGATRSVGGWVNNSHPSPARLIQDTITTTIGGHC